MTAVLILLDFLLAPLGADDYRTRAEASRRLGRLPVVALFPLVARGLAHPDDEVRHRCRLLVGRVEFATDPARRLLYGTGRIDDVPAALTWDQCRSVNAEWARLGLEHLADPCVNAHTARHWVREYRANLRGRTAGYVPFSCFPRDLPYYDPDRE